MKDKVMQWHRHIEKQANSPITIQAYCDQHRLSAGMFYYWKRKLGSMGGSDQFQEIQITTDRSSMTVLHVRFPTGVDMWFDHPPSASFLRELAGC